MKTYRKFAGDNKVSIEDFLAAKMHEAFTTSADRLAQSGEITQDERIELSSLIGNVLDKFNEEIESGVGSREVEAEVKIE